MFCLAQATYEGQVIDKATENTLPGVTVTLQKAHILTMTNSQGHFSLVVKNEIPNDTLIFTYVGYNTYRLAVAKYEQQMFVPLQPGSALLKEVSIAADKIKTVVLGKFNMADIKEVDTKAYKYFTLPLTFRYYAKFFEAPQANSVLTMIKLGRRDFGNDSGLEFHTVSKYTRFLIHVLTANPDNGEPGTPFFTKEISLTDNSQMVTIDLSKDKVVIPGNKFYIAIEWLIIPLNEIISFHYGEKVEKFRPDGTQLKFAAAEYSTLYQPVLVLYTRYHSERRWWRATNMSWGNLDGMPQLSEIEPAKLWVKDHDKWKQLLSSHEVALSATLHY